MAFARFMQREKPFSRLASEYVATNCYIGVSPFDVRQIPMDQLVGKDADQNPLPGFHIGADNAMFGADYPHFESIVPNTMDKVAGLAGDPSVTDDDVRKILFDNAAEVYDFDRAVLQPHVDRVGFEVRQTCSRDESPRTLERPCGGAMTVTPAALSRPQSGEGSAPYVPPGDYRGRLDDFDYVEEEWFATGEADGRTYTTTVFVRRPRDQKRFSGTVVVEPLHAMGAPPIWLYTSDYIMRSGHGWAVIASQKTALDAHVKSFNPERYESLAIEADPPPPDAPEVDALNLPVGDPAKMAAFFAEMQRQNQRVQHDPRSGGRGDRGVGGPVRGLGRRARDPDRAFPDRWRRHRLHPQRPRIAATRRRLPRVPRLLPVRRPGGTVRRMRRADRAGGQRG